MISNFLLVSYYYFFPSFLVSNRSRVRPSPYTLWPVSSVADDRWVRLHCWNDNRHGATTQKRKLSYTLFTKNTTCTTLTFSIWPFKCQFSAAAGALINLNAHCGAVFCCSDEKNVHLMGQYCPIHVPKVKNDPRPLKWEVGNCQTYGMAFWTSEYVLEYINIFNKDLIGGNQKVYYLITQLFSPKELLVQLQLSYLFYFVKNLQLKYTLCPH